MKSIFQKLLPAVLLGLFAVSGFAASEGTGPVKSQGVTTVYGAGDTAQAPEPAPDCKKKPEDPRCRDKKAE